LTGPGPSGNALLIYYAPLAAAAAFAAFLLLVGLSVVIANMQRETLLHGEQLASDVNTIVFQLVNGISALRATGAEERAFARWGQDFAEMRSRAFRSQRIGTVFETCLAGFDVLTLASVFLLLALMRSSAPPDRASRRRSASSSAPTCRCPAR
jgi:ABC-type bacteriocin/lantibiotic exporter with double-glycine peptidase domain